MTSININDCSFLPDEIDNGNFIPFNGDSGFGTISSYHLEPAQDDSIYNHNNDINNPHEFSNHNVDEIFENDEEEEEDDDYYYEGRPELLRNKLKTHVLKNFLEFINGKIEKKRYKIKKVQCSSTKKKEIDFEKQFMNSTLGDIFSSRVSDIYTSSVIDHENHNKLIIDKLKLEDDKFKKIFDIKYIQCLKYFIGKKYLKVLEGMNTIEKTKFNDEKDKENLINFGKCYKKILKNSRGRESSKKKNLPKKNG